jgi:hypothetical protein
MILIRALTVMSLPLEAKHIVTPRGGFVTPTPLAAGGPVRPTDQLILSN